MDMEFSFWEELIFGIGFTLGSIRDAVVSERRVMPFCAPAIFSWSQRGTHSTAETNEFDQNPPQATTQFETSVLLHFQRIDLCSALTSARPFDSKQGLRRLDPRPSHRALILDDTVLICRHKRPSSDWGTGARLNQMR